MGKMHEDVHTLIQAVQRVRSNLVDEQIRELQRVLGTVIGVGLARSLNYRPQFNQKKTMIWFDAEATQLLGVEITYELVGFVEGSWLAVRAEYFDVRGQRQGVNSHVTSADDLMRFTAQMRERVATPLGKLSHLKPDKHRPGAFNRLFQRWHK